MFQGMRNSMKQFSVLSLHDEIQYGGHFDEKSTIESKILIISQINDRKQRFFMCFFVSRQKRLNERFFRIITLRRNQIWWFFSIVTCGRNPKKCKMAAILMKNPKFMNSEIINSVKNLLPIGRTFYSAFMKDRILAQKVSQGAIMPKTKLPLMGYSSKPT